MCSEERQPFSSWQDLPVGGRNKKRRGGGSLGALKSYYFEVSILKYQSSFVKWYRKLEHEAGSVIIIIHVDVKIETWKLQTHNNFSFQSTYISKDTFRRYVEYTEEILNRRLDHQFCGKTDMSLENSIKHYPL